MLAFAGRIAAHRINSLLVPVGRELQPFSELTTGFASSSSHRSLASTSSAQTASVSAAEDSLCNDLFDTKERAQLTPNLIVGKLDKFIVGQADAKRAVAVALRNRWRRLKLPSPMREEVIPKNILMIGPTGCGKTEIARRLAKLTDSPFIKVEATKYTELGYVGRDVEDIVKDLVEASISLVRTRMRERLAVRTAEKAENTILESLVGPHADKATLDIFREMYRSGKLDDRTVDMEMPAADSSKKINFENGIILFDSLLRGEKGLGGLGGRRPGSNKKKMRVGDAKEQIEEQETEKMMQSDVITREAVRAAEQDGIVFIDEIDKIVDGGRRFTGGGSVSSEGVQRDLLPIIEGSVVSTKYGNVSTDHVLFICSGAFHSSKPSDMLAELQGRLPIRVELKGLTADDFYRILTEPENSMIRQQQVLLATEGVELEMTEGAVRATARAAEEANRLLENIGARRLHTVLERILGDISFSASEKMEDARRAGLTSYRHTVDEAMVDACMQPLLKKQDLSRYVL